MPTYRPPRIATADITDRSLYLGRRHLLGLSMGGLAALAAPALTGPARAAALTASKSSYDPGEPLTPKEVVTTYNNFYEFGTGKDDPAKNAGSFKPTPWAITVDGLVGKPKTFGLEEILAMPQEERIYRMRCVEAWSMVIPWDGVPLAALLNAVEPESAAKYVAFETVVRPEEMPGQSGVFQSLPWPYVEGLRLDEAMHPLTILATGVYGETLPNSMGAPVRLVVPWKYGFKGIKSIVRITLTDKQPMNTWQQANPAEYGFYANVNPAVDHPRWSQATERRITGGGFFANDERRDTLPFNGYAEEVASLYAGMDLKANF